MAKDSQHETAVDVRLSYYEIYNDKVSLTARAIMGGGNGNMSLMRTILAEMVPHRELQPRAFSIKPLVKSLATIFGPGLGGFLAQPARQYPSVFGDSAFFNRFPFALPNFVAVAVFFVSVLTALLFLKETLETKRDERDWGLVLGEKLTRPFHGSRSTSSLSHDDEQVPLLAEGNEHMSTPTKLKRPSLSDVFTRRTVINVTAYTLLAMHSTAYDQVLPVFLNYPAQELDHADVWLPLRFVGGFGMSSDQIGTISMLDGVASSVIQFCLFPWLCARFGVLTCFRVAVAVYPLVYVATPFLALIAGERLQWATLLALLALKSALGIVASPCTVILLTNGASSWRVLGTLNGFVTTFSAIGRALGNAATGATFTWGAERGYGVAPWWLLAAVAAIGAVPSSCYMVDDEIDVDTKVQGTSCGGNNAQVMLA